MFVVQFRESGSVKGKVIKFGRTREEDEIEKEHQTEEVVSWLLKLLCWTEISMCAVYGMCVSCIIIMCCNVCVCYDIIHKQEEDFEWRNRDREKCLYGMRSMSNSDHFSK